MQDAGTQCLSMLVLSLLSNRRAERNVTPRQLQMENLLTWDAMPYDLMCNALSIQMQ